MQNVLRKWNGFLFFGVTVLSLSCGMFSQKRGSRLETTSDKLKEFGYEMKGTIEIPLKPESLYISFLLDSYRPVLDHAEDEEAKLKLDQILKSEEDFLTAFNETYKNAFPVADGDKVDRSKVQYWISQQIRYTSKQLEPKGVSVTLKSIKDMDIIFNPDRQSITVNYNAQTLGVINAVGSEYLDLTKRLQEGDSFNVPYNLNAFYFETMGPEFQDFYQDSLKGLSDTGIQYLIKSDRPKALLPLTKDNSVKNNCFTADGDHVSPYAYFYYFDDKLPGCLPSSNLTKLVVSKVLELKTKTTYPEYHRLFADNKVEMFIFYNSVSGEEITASTDLENLLQSRGYAPSSDPQFKQEPNHKKLDKNIEGIIFSIEWSVGYEGSKFFEQAIKTHEIIVYDGHAGYGANISDAFNKEESFPENKYQIFFLGGCSTYKYGMTQLLDIKALRDFDFYHQNIDLITTYSSVKGHKQHDALIDTIEAVIPYYLANNWTNESKALFESKFSWLPIVTEINKISDWYGKDNGMFMVNGEEDNDYLPGTTVFDGLKEYSADELLAFISDLNNPERARITALKAYGKKFLRVTQQEGLTAVINKGKSICGKYEYQDGMDQVLATMFYLPACSLKKVELDIDSELDSHLYSKEKPILLTLNGKIKQALLARDEVFGKYKVRGKSTIVFSENGNLKYFSPAESFIDEYGRKVLSSIPVYLYESGKIMKAYVDEVITRENVNFKGQMSFFEDGTLWNGQVAKSTTSYDIQGFKVVTDGANYFGTQIRFFATGKIQEINGDGVTSLRNELKLPEKAIVHVLFFANGQYASIDSYGEHNSVAFTLDNLRYFRVAFREDGSKTMLSYADQIDTPRMPCETGTEEGLVIFDRQDILVSCKLNSSFVINNRTYEAGHYIVWTADGRVIEENNTAAILEYLKEIGVDIDYHNFPDEEYFEENWQ